ncbi:Sentrin-specific protease [Babesia sp. Xinjiang]|uniref:Sentrin-specific protease n=1 Tax=Babesia sp. Xinjiang TaxID=462227 RepID=UPI000A239A89|nr:Sentrin-specific protease [Babesia sp. Xinjiang]ORM40771.1 Sentrin-specific protease [Babesia sp. Xinjiang]
MGEPSCCKDAIPKTGLEQGNILPHRNAEMHQEDVIAATDKVPMSENDGPVVDSGTCELGAVRASTIAKVEKVENSTTGSKDCSSDSIQDYNKCYDSLIHEMSKLSVASSSVTQDVLEIAVVHRAKSKRLELRLCSLEDVKHDALIDPLHTSGEPGYDIWDLKAREATVQSQALHLAALFQNDSSNRWLNVDSLGSEAKALAVVRRGLPSQVLADKFGIEMTRKHLACLDGPHWLNDEVINFFIGMIQERNDRLVRDGVSGVPRCFCFNTFFFSMLCGADDPWTNYNYKSVERWTTRRKVDVFSLDILLIPVHKKKTHWCLGVVDMRPGSRCIMLFDSLGGSHRTFFTNVRKWLQDEHFHKKHTPLKDLDTWKYSRTFQSESAAPRQHNGYDCGVFLCQYAECLSIGKLFDFSQRDVRSRRIRMIQQILRGSIFE